MTYIITGEDKPPLDEIYHYGVKDTRQYKNNPNRTRASRTTRGEKAALAIVTSPSAGVGARTARNAVVRKYA